MNHWKSIVIFNDLHPLIRLYEVSFDFLFYHFHLFFQTFCFTYHLVNYLSMKSLLPTLLINLVKNLTRAMNLKQKLELKQALFQAEMGETVPEFFKRCKSAQDEFCDLFYSEVLNERELLLNFVNGLRPEIQQSLLENEELALETLETTLEAAIKIEASFFKTEIDIISSEEQHRLPENELEEHGCLQELSFFEEIINEDKYDPLLSDIFKCLQCGFSYTTQELLDHHTLK